MLLASSILLDLVSDGLQKNRVASVACERASLPGTTP